MSIYLMTAIWKGVDLPTNRKVVLLKLADHADDEGQNCWPSVGRIAHECGVVPRTVQMILREFEKEEIIRIEGNPGGGRGRSRHYRIDVERAQQLHPLPSYQQEKGRNSSAPFSPEKGADHNRKGAAESTKGCKSFAPKPSGTNTENRHRGRAPGDSQRRLFNEPSASRSKRGASLPNDWRPSFETIRWAKQEGFSDEDFRRELARFADHAVDKGRLSKDWNRAFRNWLRKAQDYDAERRRLGTGDPRGGDGILDVGARFAARGGG